MVGAVQSESIIPLGDGTLGQLAEGVQRPGYDRSQLRAGIIHIGVGNFHRAHQAWYLHRLMQQGSALDWAIVGAGVRAGDARMRETLLAQDCLTTLIELDPDGKSAEVIGPMIDFLPVETGNTALIARMSDPAIRIVTLTVTEGGYYIDPATNAFDAEHPDMVHDAAAPSKPRTCFGAMVAALRSRRDAGVGPFSGLSCDNLVGNGQVLRQTVVSLARLSDPELADWIDNNASFPNSMVDCIVPATGSTELALARGFGIADAAPVTHENYRQWVIEDDFCAGRPDWDRVGATFTDQVHDYEAMKLRCLNAGHQVLANAGEILGVGTIADCMAHLPVSAFFDKVLTEEVAPHVRPVPGMSAADYVALIRRRFENPAIFDTTRRVAFDGSSRHPSFVVPVIRDALAAGALIEGLSLVEALWARMCVGKREDGSRIEANDPQWALLVDAAEVARHRPVAWLEQGHLYGDLAGEPRFADAFARWLDVIWRDGTVAALNAYCGLNTSD